MNEVPDLMAALKASLAHITCTCPRDFDTGMFDPDDPNDCPVHRNAS